LRKMKKNGKKIIWNRGKGPKRRNEKGTRTPKKKWFF